MQINSLKDELAEVRQSRLLMRKFEQLITQAPGFIAIVDMQGYVSYLNGFARNVVGLKPDESIPPGVEFFMAPEERGTFHDDLMPLIRSGEQQQFKLRILTAQAEAPVRALFTMYPLHNGEGRKIGYGLWAEDIEDQEAETELRENLKAEALHRLQNSFGVTTSIVSQTLRAATSFDEANAAIAKRILAMGRALMALKPEANARADIVEVIRSALEPHDPGGERIRISGPSFMMDGQQVQGLSLGLHELATNAAKYGALKTDLGGIDISWTIGDNGSFFFNWQEIGGPEVVAPSRKGFGSRLIKTVGPYFFGIAETEYAAEGVQFTIKGNLTRAA